MTQPEHRPPGLPDALDASVPPPDDHEDTFDGEDDLDQDDDDLEDGRGASAGGSQTFRSVFYDAPVGMGLIDLSEGAEGAFLRVNAALAALTGRDVPELLRMSLMDLLHPDDPLQAVGAVGIASHRREREVRLMRSDGTVLWVVVSSSRVGVPGRAPCAVVHLSDVTARKNAEGLLAHQAMHDPLTGLANRRLLTERLALYLEQVGRDGGCLAVLYLDLDGFKQINDTYGHEVGDDVLRQVSLRLGRVLRGPDSLARLGGDEFVAVARVANQAGATRLAGRLQASLATPVPTAAGPVQARATIGLATAESGVSSAEDLLREADLAMYFAKDAGAGQVRRYDEDLRRRARWRADVRDDLRRALEENWCQVLYQPVRDLQDGRVLALDAQVRVDHPTRGILHPEWFQGVVQETALTERLERWALATAVGQLAAWGPAHPRVAVAVTLSCRPLLARGLAATVVEALERAGADPSRLWLQMTETALEAAGPDVVGDLTSLDARGVRVVLEGFGTGTSSLTRLHALPVRCLKVAPEPGGRVVGAPQDDGLLRAVLATARALGTDVVVGDIVSARQLERVRRLGCRVGQGQHLGAAVQARAVDDLLAAQPVAAPALVRSRRGASA